MYLYKKMRSNKKHIIEQKINEVCNRWKYWGW